HDGGGSEQFWVLAARMLFVEMCLKLVAEGRATNAALSAELMTASLAHVHKLMEGTVADPLTAPEAARMAESIRAVFNANAKALRM
ncbi:type IV secretion system DNA-binding domain-containing protein, partial [Klebsiella pneumoniae]|nr:type IV secretion system DNA-binding domain-containing protein [Klebsiella pneumoniae]